GRVAPKLSVGRRAGYAAAGLLFAAALGAKLLPAVASFGVPADDATRAALQGAGAAKGAVLGNVERVADLLYTSYLLPFELASVVLLVGMVGAVVVARRRA
ncbi:MAG TPA: NADH-quinone oxidoreductase subunit J, partial [Acidobacteriota bacterium]|nr:NADH-quinone oxidoreductase subunit J [Acidobacteriota bacterium]